MTPDLQQENLKLRKKLQQITDQELAKFEGTAARLNNESLSESPYIHGEQKYLHAAWCEGWMEQDKESQVLQRALSLENLARQLVESSQDFSTCPWCKQSMFKHSEACSFHLLEELLQEAPSTTETMDDVDELFEVDVLTLR